MQTATLSSGQTIAYDLIGDAQATPVVLLHGLSSNRRVYNHLAQDLAELLSTGTLLLINIDLRGHSESSHAAVGKYSASDYAHDVAELLQTISSKPAIVLAESLGGVIGMALAQSHPALISGLFLEDPPLYLGEPTRFKNNPISKEFPEFIELIDDMQARTATLDEYAAILRDDSEPDELNEFDRYIEGLPAWHTDSMRDAVSGNLWYGFDPLAPVNCPLTILRADPQKGAAFGEEDVQPMLAVQPAARIVLVDGATHSLRTTRHAVFLEELHRFMRTVL